MPGEGYTPVNFTLRVINSSVGVYSGPGTNNAKTGTLAIGAIVTSTEMYVDWYHHASGWSCGFGKNNIGTSIKTLEYIDPNNITAITNDTTGGAISVANIQTIKNFMVTASQQTIINAAKFKDMRGVFGLPYHFLDDTDKNLNDFYADAGSSNDNLKGYEFGRKYTERILSRMPLLILSPGSPSFLEGYDKEAKTTFVSNMLGASYNDNTQLNTILDPKEGGRYYTFKYEYAEYYKYVNGMCWACAKFLGIHDTKIPFTVEDMAGKTYAGTGSSFDWSFYPSNSLKGFFSGKQYVSFFIEADSQVSESFSNSTKASMIDSGMNALSDLGKEADFLMGAGMGVKMDAMNSDNYKANIESINEALSPFSDPSKVIERLSSGIVTVSAGGQLIFPEIWSDSSFSKSYDVTIKLISPDGDDESIYLNIFVPLFHLMGMVVPMQLGTNGYRTPFLVRGYYRGIFNVDMGIITNMTMRKGDNGAWNINGLPTELEVTLSIKDLYEILTMTKYTDSDMFVNNAPMLDFLATMSGISINKPELFRKAEMWATLRYQTVRDWPRNKWTEFSNDMTNFLQGIVK